MKYKVKLNPINDIYYYIIYYPVIYVFFAYSVAGFQSISNCYYANLGTNSNVVFKILGSVSLTTLVKASLVGS